MATKKVHRTTVLYAIGKILLYPFYKLVYRIRVTGRENIPAQGPVLICCNHMAQKDPVLLGVMTRRQVFYMAKEELFRNKFIGGVLRALGAKVRACVGIYALGQVLCALVGLAAGFAAVLRFCWLLERVNL